MKCISRWLCAVVTAMLALAGGMALAAQPSPALKGLITAAQKEGKLYLQFGSGTMGDSQELAGMVKAMNNMFGTSIALRFTPGPSEPQMVSKIIVAQAAHLPSPTDVQIGTNQFAAEMYKRKAADKVNWLSLLPHRIQPQSVEADGHAIRIFTTLPGGIIYNTKLAPEKPERLTDLLKPEWKGKIASTPYAAGWELLSASDVWGMKRALDFARKLSTQVAGLMRCNELSRIASGEFIAFAMNCGSRDWLKMKREGAPLDYVVPKDFAAERFYYATVPKNAPHPDAAKLFVTFLETPEGQRQIFKATLTDLHTYPDSQFASVIDNYEKTGLKFQQFTVTWFLKHPEAREGSRKAVQILRGH